MRLDTKCNDVTASGMLDQRDFTIKAGAHIMAVLSGLYKNPIDAMVREYLTNMYDAYVALTRKNPSAKIVPPVLHLPTTLDGSLIFRDNGIGMSKDTVWNVYSQYGNSTKNDDNLEVGGFGLGSKTAFCYNGGASWTIESRYNGEKHTFMAFVGENGIPNLTHVDTSPTDEHSGVTIKIPIRREDHRLVYAAARRYVPYFPMELTVEGDSEITPVDYSIKTDNWGLVSASKFSSYDANRPKSQIIMGNVPYPIDWEHVKYPVYKPVTPYSLQSFLQSNVFDLFVNIGAVDIVPSRDDMKYTDKTKKTIQSAINQVLHELGKHVGNKLDSCKTEWEALITYQTMRDIPNIRSVVPSILYKGKQLEPGTGIVRTLTALQKLDPAITVTVYGTDGSASYNGDTTDRATIDERDKDKLAMIPNDRTFIVIDDMAKGGVMMTRAMLYDALINRNRSTNRPYRYGHKIGHAILLKTTLSKKQLSDFFGGVPESLIRTTSELKGIVNVPTALKALKNTIYRWSGSTWAARVTIPTIASGETAYYVPLTADQHTGRYRYTFTANHYSNREAMDKLIDIASSLEILEYGKNTIYGIKSSDVANFDSTVWINLEAAVKDEVISRIPKVAESSRAADSSPDTNVTKLIEVLVESQLATKTQSRPAADPLFDEFIETVSKYQRLIADTEMTTVLNFARHDEEVMKKLETAKKAIKLPDFKKMELNIRAKYPLLSLVAELYSTSGYYSSNSIDRIRTTISRSSLLDYVNEKR